LSRIVAAGASDPYILRHISKFDDEKEGLFSFHGSLYHDSSTAGHFGERRQ
jgi:hypothetical protein